MKFLVAKFHAQIRHVSQDAKFFHFEDYVSLHKCNLCNKDPLDILFGHVSLHFQVSEDIGINRNFLMPENSLS